MNPNDRQKAVVLAVILGVLAVGFLGYLFFYQPYLEASANIERLRNEVATKHQQIADINKDKLKLERWRLLSLPGEVATPVKAGPGGFLEKDNPYFDLEDQYRAYLNELLRKHNIAHDYPNRSKNEAKTFVGPGQAAGPPPYTTLVFEVKNIKTKLPNLVAWLIDFQNTPLLQRIKKLSIKKDDSTTTKTTTELLKVELIIEAIIVQGAKKRPKTMLGPDERLVALDALTVLRRGPAGLALVPWVVGPTGPNALPALKEKAPEYDLGLLAGLNDVSGIPIRGKHQIIVAKVKNMLHFRIFDRNGKMVADTDEKQFPEKARQLQDLRVRLQNLWPPHDLSRSEKSQVVTAVTAIVGQAQEPTRDYTAIARKNIFVGMVPYTIKGSDTGKKGTSEEPSEIEKAIAEGKKPAQKVKDVLRFARLTDISGDVKQLEANLWNPLTQRVIRLREQKGYDRFPLLLNSNDSTVVYGKVIRFDGTRGLIFRIQLEAREPSKMADKPYPETNAFYHPTKNDFDELLKEHPGKVKAEDRDRVYKVSRRYWEILLRDKVMERKFGKGVLGDFVAQKYLLRGKVVEAKDNFVVIRLEERSSAYRDDVQDVRVDPHFGFCMLTGRLSDALRSPVAEPVARQLLVPVQAVGTVEPEFEEDP